MDERIPVTGGDERERPAYAEVVEALADMVSQHCITMDDGIMDGSLSSNEWAIDVLLRAGVMKRLNTRPERYAFDLAGQEALRSIQPAPVAVASEDGSALAEKMRGILNGSLCVCGRPLREGFTACHACVAMLHDRGDAIRHAMEIIEEGDRRLLALDGPCGGQPPRITLEEWRDLYECLKVAAAPIAVVPVPEARPDGWAVEWEPGKYVTSDDGVGVSFVCVFVRESDAFEQAEIQRKDYADPWPGIRTVPVTLPATASVQEREGLTQSVARMQSAIRGYQDRVQERTSGNQP